MRARSSIALALAGAVALAAAAPATLGAATKRKPQKKTVDVRDNYYSPSKLTINKGSKVTWAWDDGAVEVHDVKLVKGPKGEKKFLSEPGGVGYKYTRTFKTPGTYKIICTFHETDMKMTITVRK